MVKAKDPDSFTSYISDEKSVKKFVRQMLKNHKFVGNYLEHRYVPHLGRYKKIVKIANTEDVFIENLSVVKRRIEKFYGDSKWVGITFPNTVGAPVGFNLWVEIDEEIFGTYVFWVRKVEFTEKEIYLKLEVLASHNERETSLNSTFEKSSFFDGISCEDSIVSWNNFKKASVFAFLLTVAIVTGGGQIIMFLMDYMLKLLREFRNIISVTTPIIIACINTISKMFGYLCFLIAVLWKGDKKPQPIIHQIKYQPAFPYEHRYKALPYRENSVQITEIE